MIETGRWEQHRAPRFGVKQICEGCQRTAEWIRTYRSQTMKVPQFQYSCDQCRDDLTSALKIMLETTPNKGRYSPYA